MMIIHLTAMTLILATYALPDFGDLGYLGRGYNIYTGNPHYAFDEGFENPVFTVAMNKKNAILSADQRFSMPFGVDLVKTSSCDLVFQSTLVNEMQVYANQLSFTVSGEMRLFPAPFSANAEYRRLEKIVKNSTSLFIETIAVCEKYSARLNLFADLAPLSKDFSEGVKSLGRGFNQSDPHSVRSFMKFFKEFGTHVVVQVSMGTRLIVRHEMEASSYMALSGRGIRVEVAASLFATNKFKPNATELFNFDKEEIDAFISSRISTRIFSSGSQLTNDDDIEPWFTSKEQTPSPIRYQVEPIYDFVPPNLRSDVIKALTTFCHQTKNARCTPIPALEQKIDPICPSVEFRDHWSGHMSCLSKPAVLKGETIMTCPKSSVMSGLRFAMRRAWPASQTASAVSDLGCVALYDLDARPGQGQWTNPEKRASHVCPQGHLVTGIKFTHHCSEQKSRDEFVSLQCAQSAIPPTHCHNTSFVGMETLPSWGEGRCSHGTVMTGLDFEIVDGAQKFQLRCCQVGKQRCSVGIPRRLSMR